MKLGGKINTSPRYVIEIAGTVPLSLEGLGKEVNSKKLEKMISYFKSRPDPVSLGVGGWKSWKTLKAERSG